MINVYGFATANRVAVVPLVVFNQCSNMNSSNYCI